VTFYADAYVKAVLLGTVEPPVTPGNSGTATAQASVILLTYILLFPAASCKTAVTLCADAYVKAVLLGTVEPPVTPGNSGTATVQLWMEQPRTATVTNTIEEWDIVNLTPDGECLALTYFYSYYCYCCLIMIIVC
jgi:hypothetical protein